MDWIPTAEEIAQYIEHLKSNSTKGRLAARDARWVAANGSQPMPDVWRRADQMQGLMTKEQITEMYADPGKYKDQMLIQCGLAIVSNGEAYFFSDDSGFGHSVLHNGFAGCQLGEVHHHIGPGYEYENIDALFARHGHNERYLGSLEELALYVLTGK